MCPLSDWYPPATTARTTTPMVFCASWRPRPSAIADAETICALRKRRFTRCGFARRQTHRVVSMTRKATLKPTNGESTIGTTTLSTTWSQRTAVEDASSAPTRPPMRACDDDDGSQKYHVSRFHVMAPTSAAAMTTKPCTPPSISRMSLTGLRDLLPEERPDEVHDRGQGQGDDRDDDGGLHAHDSLTAMVSTVSATCSKASAVRRAARSSRSTWSWTYLGSSCGR
jgi:hypothetical protein